MEIDVDLSHQVAILLTKEHRSWLHIASCELKDVKHDEDQNHDP